MDLKKDKMEWRCGWCGRKYTTDEMLNLDKAFAKKNNPDYGFVSICECGKRFHTDKWKLVNKWRLFPNIIKSLTYPTLRLSTVDLHLNHFGNYYETMLFFDDKIIKIGKWKINFTKQKCEVNYQYRYPDQESAYNGHKKLYAKILSRKFILRQKEEDPKILEMIFNDE